MTIKQQGGIFGRNPTFNDVEVSGDLTVSGSVTVPNNSVSGDAIDGGSAGLTSLQIDGTGNSTPLKIFGNTGVADEHVILCLSGSNTDIRAVHLRAVTRGSGAGQGHHLDIMTSPDGGDPIRRVRYSYDGDVIFYEPTGVTEKMRWDASAGNLAFASGNGIDFSATSGTGTSELFDDYEEGTFTPVVADAASGGNVDPTTQRGVYTKIGRLVNITIELEDVDTATNSMSGTLFIRDLPFTPASLTGKIRYVSPVLFGSGVTFDTSHFYTAQIQDALSYATIKEVRSGTTPNNLEASALTSGSNDINMQFSYYV